jgi:hypothetical protein
MSRFESFRLSRWATCTALGFACLALFFGVTAASAASLDPLESDASAAPPGQAMDDQVGRPATGSLFDETPIFTSAPISDRVIGPVGAGGLDLGPVLGNPMAQRK